MLTQLNQYMEEHTLLLDYLSAYRTGYSTESVLLRLQNEVSKGMDEQNVTALAALDLSAAFDTMDHQVFVQVLNKKFGICGHALDWLETYLRPLTLQVQIGTALSRKKYFSVPQGSCAGPVLYNTCKYFTV